MGEFCIRGGPNLYPSVSTCVVQFKSVVLRDMKGLRCRVAILDLSCNQNRGLADWMKIVSGNSLFVISNPDKRAFLGHLDVITTGSEYASIDRNRANESRAVSASFTL